MAISFPRALPANFTSDQYFEVQRLDYSSPENSGRIAGVQAGFPKWEGIWTISAALGRLKADEVRAWLDSMDGPTRLFYGADQQRPFPLLYQAGFTGLNRAGGGSFDGTATSWSVDTPGEVLTLNGLPIGLALSVGDYVGFSWTTSSQPRRSLVRLSEAAVANGSGVLAATVRPALPPITSGSAVATLDHPVCLMKLNESKTSISAMQRRLAIGGTIAALQQLLP